MLFTLDPFALRPCLAFQLLALGALLRHPKLTPTLMLDQVCRAGSALYLPRRAFTC